MWLNFEWEFMFVALLALSLTIFSGTILTYFYEREDSLLVRLCAGNIVGAILFGLIALLAACAFGFSAATISISLLITLLPAFLLIQKRTREKFAEDLKNAAGKLENTNLQKISSLIYYSAFLILLYFFFERAMFETPNGIFTGGSQNFGDLPFHLGAIFSFTEGNNFPPENPSFAFAKFTYPFMADFLAACFVKLGANVRQAMLIQNVALGFSLVVLFEKFAFALTKNHLAKRLAPVIFLLSGGLGFLLFFRDYWHDGRSFFEFLWNLSKDYTIRPENFRWGNPLVVLFMTQRSFLLGMPLTLIALTKLWEIFSSARGEMRNAESGNENQNDNGEIEDKTFSISHFPFSVFLVGLLAGNLPLVHVHSLAVLFVVAAFLFFLRMDKWRAWIAFGVGTAIVAVPELLWAMTGSATNLGKFIEWHFGWNKGEQNFFYFWLINLGLFIPLLFASVYFIFSTRRRRNSKTENKEQNTKNNSDKQANQLPITNYRLLIFYLPFVFLFVISNVMNLAPWEWDNIKVLIYWFVGSVPLVAWFLAELWKRNYFFKILTAISVLILTASGALDVWRTISRQRNDEIFSPDAGKIAEQIRQKTPPQALFLNAPTYNSAVVLSGRRSLMRYSGHLASYGIDYEPRETEVERIYEGTALADSLLKKNGIEYVIVSPEETSNLNVNEEFFSKFPVIAESGAYRVYQVNK
ncbi:MAG: hypothetical protein ACR2GD_12805 [Pyrinomonadaceae bacterium]